MSNRIWFVEPNDHHDNYGIMAEGDENFIQRLDYISRRDFVARYINDPLYDEKKSWGFFHQGSSADWTYWEFWAEQTPEFRKKVEDKIEAIKKEMETPDEYYNQMYGE